MTDKQRVRALLTEIGDSLNIRSAHQVLVEMQVGQQLERLTFGTFDFERAAGTRKALVQKNDGTDARRIHELDI